MLYCAKPLFVGKIREEICFLHLTRISVSNALMRTIDTLHDELHRLQTGGKMLAVVKSFIDGQILFLRKTV